MDPSENELDSSLPQPENPCLIVEDSQPDSVALEDDPESSYRALLARRLSSLQPTARSPVLVSCTLITIQLYPRCYVCWSYERNKLKVTDHDERSCLVLMSLFSCRSEVSSSSSSESLGQSGRQLSVQVLLHSQSLQNSDEQNQDCEILSSQEDLFDGDKTGAAVDSTVSEPEQQGHPTATPANSLRLLHLSGQGTLVQESLSQSSVDCIAPTPDNFHHTPLIVPSSPTDKNCADEPMDTSLPPDERASEKDEPMETEAASKPLPSASTPVSQNSPGFALKGSLSIPSQPEFSHVRTSFFFSVTALVSDFHWFVSVFFQDVFVPTQSQEAPQQSDRKSASLPCETQSQLMESAKFTLPLQLSVNTQNSSQHQRTSEQVEEDSQATQIEELEEKPNVDASDSVSSCRDQKQESNAIPSESQAATSSKASTSAASPKHHSKSAEIEQHKQTLNVQNVNVKAAKSDSREAGSAAVVSCSQPKLDSSGLTVNSCVQETPCSLPSQSMIYQTSAVDVVKSSVSAKSPSVESQQRSVVSNSQRDKDMMEEQEEEVVMEEENTSGMALALSQSQLLSPEPMEEEDSEVRGEDSVIVVTDSERDSQLHQKDAPLASNQPVKESISTNGHESQVQGKEVDEAPDRLLQMEKAGREAEELKEKSLSDSSGEISFHFTLPKEGELIGPAVGATPPLINQLKQTLRHSTPIEITSFSEKSDVAADVSADVAMAASDIVSGESVEDSAEKGDGKLSLRMKLVTPVEEGSSEHFSLQSKNMFDAHTKPVAFASSWDSPSVFSRVRQVHRQQEAEEDSQPGGNSTPGEPESPSFRRTTVPTHRRHVRTIQEVRTTVTRIITDVYYEDGKEVDRKVTEESEEPVVDCQVLDSDISPCRTGSSSLTSGDLGDISSLSSKASSLQHSSSGTSSSTGLSRPEFIIPTRRGAKSMRGAGCGPLQRFATHGQPQSYSEDEPYSRMLPPRLPVSPTDHELPSHSDSLRSSPEEASSAGSSFVGLRVVAKWSSNGYFYSGRIMKDAGEGRFRLRFDDGYECEVAGKDVLLCDPIPLETEVTALLEDEYFSIGVVKGHKTEGQELFYNVEKEGQKQWYNRTSIILSLEQGNKLREQHSLGPYEPSTPLAKASDISLDNLVEGKRRRRGTPGGQNTPNRSSSSSPRTPGPSGKRKLLGSDDNRSAAKRGRRGGGARAAQRVGVCNTSGSGTDVPGRSCDVSESHGPLPQNTSLFMGFAFMLTASSEVDRLTNKLTSDDEEDYVQTGPYNKSYTESQLQAGGGFILPDFNEEQCKAAYQSLLIADQHCRTRKYLLCLASGVPCVSHIWVRDCCKDNKLLNYRNYLLPAGIGPDDAIVEWHPRCSPFKTLRVLLVFEKPVELWAQLITLGGGSSVRHFQAEKDSSDIPAGKYDIVVTEAACPPLVEKSVTSQEVPLVSPEWLIQSIICGERLGFHSKPQYRHDYSS
uniref:TP53-binding protein 1 n=1 Tax=Amphiprion ocellaris TaxID=80972 RepID=A0A3Q1ASF2_AMPOC